MSTLEVRKKQHEQMLYPTVRVRTESGGGSGTVVFSGKNAKGNYESYVITNEHVVASAIKVKELWNPRVGRMVKKDVRSTVQVELFRYNNMSHCIGGGLALKADIVAYSKEQDFALLLLREEELPIDFVATMYPRDKLDKVHIFDSVYAVGAAMGHAPLPTLGELVCMDDEIEDYNYWMSTACIIFGNSGGSVYRVNGDGDYEYIGVPSRLPISIVGFSASPITHMGYFIPIDRIYKLLDEHD